jgi:hypothetical protein
VSKNGPVPTHPIFTDLVLHSDDELGDLLGAPVAERVPVHAWPLSCVERVTLADGRIFAYKSQLPPTVEPDFYAAAASPLLPGHRPLGALGAAQTMVLDWIDAPLLEAAAPDPDDLARHGRRVVDRIGEIRGTLPSYLDIGSGSAWTAVTTQTYARWERTIEIGHFTRTTPTDVDQIRAWSARPAVLAAIAAAPRVLHGDLKADQVFVTDDGYRVIDWQRPVRGPAEVDLVSLLVGRGLDPRPAADPAVVAVFWFLRLHWAVEAQHSLFPGSRFPLFDDWAHEAVTGILAV